MIFSIKIWNVCINVISFVFSHITKTTTWDDPRKTLAAQSVAGSVQHQSTDALLTQAASPQNIPNTPAPGSCLFTFPNNTNTS